MVEDTFSAAHQLFGYDGPCEKLHGHTFKVQVFIKGSNLKKEGFLLDFKEIKSILKENLAEFDHTNLNELGYFKKENPTSENIARALYLKLIKILPIIKVTVWESPNASAAYYE
ncbi:MAG: 6-pyruvoyl tetrahydrobiopterin synthase [Candidatus Saganbacteria bacterium]|uniref:6-carboxy-5,6,7,8-tetrahydropterin synthase n=1 Tax=Candidatus Saganbacteria bacterium TaxID=2575572 RepID=A0A833L1E7_UNCSA|nr:MAG: 6-pyruvoyl tetrahydrobiopterin synthase [Candidatus Saganbacteria bacterium]